ncbi:unnamed protein product [Ilex paraguariensis]|uniref:Sec16 Sec23-binding domain-containing protein n=1 Tax=Ilex paraguariensis TaxID=185542 RepID=A0ABC8TSV0_9AQUA
MEAIQLQCYRRAWGPSLRTPKWYKRKAGDSFGFGGKLVSFHSADAVAGSSEVYLHNVLIEQSLVSCSSEFEAAIQNLERSSLRLLCNKKSQESESEDERETWGFLKVMFEDDGTARTKLLTHLGFSLPAEGENAVQDDLSQEVSAFEERVADNEGYVESKESSVYPLDNGEDFLNNLPSPKVDTPSSTLGSNFVCGGSVPSGEERQRELNGQEEIVDPSFDDAVQRALVVGDYKGAVAQSVAANRMADALVIAHIGGGSLLERTCDQYLKMNRSSYLKVVLAMVNNDVMSLVNTRPLKSWKETLALLCTVSFPPSEDEVINRLMIAGNTLAATLCYICAGNIDKTVEIWSKSLATEFEGKSYVDILQLVEKYAEILASQGLLTTAMEYLKLMGTEELSPELMILRDRIFLSTEPDKEVPNSMAFENSQPQPGAVYAADQTSYGTVDTSQNYQVNFVQPPATIQPAVKPFIPATPPPLQNAGEFQQPTLGSQLYSGNANPNYQAGPPGVGSLGPVTSHGGPPPGHNVPPVVAPTPASRGFMPITNLGMHRPGIVPVQPSSPAKSVPAQPAVTRAPPPPTVQTVDTSNVPAHQKPVIATLMRLFKETSEALGGSCANPAHQKPVIATLMRLFKETSDALGGSRANPGRKREIEDNSKRIGTLFAKLNCGDISKNAAEKLVQLCQALDNGDFSTAFQIQIQLTTSDWDECNFWLNTLKRMIKTRQNVR